MSDSQLRTVALLAGMLALVGLAGVAIVTGHDQSGALLYAILQGVLTIVGVLAGAHAANGHGPTIVRTVDPATAHEVIIGDRRTTAQTIEGGHP